MSQAENDAPSVEAPPSDEAFRSGIVALVGRPNVGKSTLMNYMIGDKISITTPVAQTTRNQIRGIQTLPEAQIVYLDTPGVHHARTALNRYMVDVAMRSLEGVDLVLYLTDIGRPDLAVMQPDAPAPSGKQPGYKEDAYILQQLAKISVPRFLIVNKLDTLAKKEKMLPFIEQYNKDEMFDEVIPISAMTGEGTEILIEQIRQRLPEGPPLFPPEYATDHAERFLVAEMIREKVILHTRQELPHSTAVLVEEFDESERDDDPEPESSGGLVRIHATIVVERNSQKGIVIGKRGSMLKEIGSEARHEIESLLGCRVWLKLWVKVEKNWSHNDRALRRLGYQKER